MIIYIEYHRDGKETVVETLSTNDEGGSVGIAEYLKVNPSGILTNVVCSTIEDAITIQVSWCKHFYVRHIVNYGGYNA